MASIELTPLQAFNVAESFIAEHFHKNQSNSFGGLLSSMIILEDGNTADAAIRKIWMEKLPNKNGITSFEALLGLKGLLDYYFEGSSSINVKHLRQEVDEIISNGEKNKVKWDKWQKHVQRVLNQQ